MTTKFVYAYKLVEQQSFILDLPAIIVHAHIGEGISRSTELIYAKPKTEGVEGWIAIQPA